jgi:hypothetical protein
MNTDHCYFCQGHPSHNGQREELQKLRNQVEEHKRGVIDPILHKANAVAVEAMKERDALLLQVDLMTKCNCPSPCNAHGCILRELERVRLQVSKMHKVVDATLKYMRYMPGSASQDAEFALIEAVNHYTEKRVEEPVKISVNGVTMELAAGDRWLSYENILKLADERPGASVVFKGAVGPNSDGSLIRGQRIMVKNGTIINAIQTGNA